MHTIKQQILDISLPQGADSWRVQQELTALFHHELQPMLNQVLNALDQPGKTLRLESLEVNLGDLPEHNWQATLKSTLPAALHKSLKEALEQLQVQAQHQAANGSSVLAGQQVSGSIQAESQTTLEALKYFVATGSLPWYTPQGPQATPQALFIEAWQQQQGPMRRWLAQALAQPTQAQRLQHQFQPHTVQQALQATHPAQLPHWQATVKALVTILQTLPETQGQTPKALATTLWHIALIFSEALAATTSQETLVQWLNHYANSPAAPSSLSHWVEALAQPQHTSPQPLANLPLPTLELLVKQLHAQAYQSIVPHLPAMAQWVQTLQTQPLANTLPTLWAALLHLLQSQPLSPTALQPTALLNHWYQHFAPTLASNSIAAQKALTKLPSAWQAPLTQALQQLATSPTPAKSSTQEASNPQPPQGSVEASSPKAATSTEEVTQESAAGAVSETGADSKHANPSQDPEAGNSGEQATSAEPLSPGSPQANEAPEATAGAPSATRQAPVEKEKPAPQDSPGAVESTAPLPQEEAAPTSAESPAALPATTASQGTGKATGPGNRQKPPKTPQYFGTGPQPETWYINNAGLVLLWPFYGRLFGAMQLLAPGNKAFASEADSHTALHLLQWMATQQEGPHPENELPLNKLLCGIHPTLPVPLEAPLPDSAPEEVEKLLTGAARGWTALGNTSPEGFRRSFLPREGSLAWHEGAWQLRIQRQGMDMLLDTLPWPLGTVKLSWMPHPIHVEW